MNSAPADQRLLLDIADLDARRARAVAARRAPEHQARVAELLARRNEQGRELVARSNARDELRTELARIQSDVEVATKRMARDRDRLTQTAIARDAIALENEIASLEARVDRLETAELETMERAQAAEAAVAEQQALLDQTTAEGQAASAAGKQAVQAATDEIAAIERDRAAVAGRVPNDLLAMYDRLAARGTGAALFQHGTCGACRMTLSPRDLAALKATADDVVALCPECGAILVRTAESGL
ncbi:C4-type zinc ribbon domain-containing protein [Microbacterium sp. ZXX196]|uniref:zinc ribbon domain-containing protein n=1 Tax=Microbacterium sp. ZXX196 TaxID=2609291 RepID=UPI0012B91D54|nr:DNA-binding protein [Microbacterium sp. ZXX196]